MWIHFRHKIEHHDGKLKERQLQMEAKWSTKLTKIEQNLRNVKLAWNVSNDTWKLAYGRQIDRYNELYPMESSKTIVKLVKRSASKVRMQ